MEGRKETFKKDGPVQKPKSGHKHVEAPGAKAVHKLDAPCTSQTRPWKRPGDTPGPKIRERARSRVSGKGKGEAYG